MLPLVQRFVLILC